MNRAIASLISASEYSPGGSAASQIACNRISRLRRFGTGFGTHGHSDVEIISIPLDGSLEHADSAGHREKLRAGEVQVMSAGTGIYHSEHNGSKEDATNSLQIWVEPRTAGGNPRL